MDMLEARIALIKEREAQTQKSNPLDQMDLMQFITNRAVEDLAAAEDKIIMDEVINYDTFIEVPIVEVLESKEASVTEITEIKEVPATIVEKKKVNKAKVGEK